MTDMNTVYVIEKAGYVYGVTPDIVTAKAMADAADREHHANYGGPVCEPNGHIPSYQYTREVAVRAFTPGVAHEQHLCSVCGRHATWAKDGLRFCAEHGVRELETQLRDARR